LDLSAVTINEVITLNASNLVNNGASPTTIDNGVAQLLLTSTSTTGSGTGYTSPTVSITGGGGSGATATAGFVAAGVIQNITTTAAGTGYTSAPTVTITDGGPGTGATATAVLSSVALTGANNIGGTGDMTINAAISGAGSVTKTGAGNVSFNNFNNTYSGSTTVNGGALFVNGSIASTSGVSVTSGTLGGNGGTLTTIALTTGQIRPGFNSTGAHFGTVLDATTINPNLTAVSLSLSNTATYVLDIGAASGVLDGSGNSIGQSSMLSLVTDFSAGGSTLQVNDLGVLVAQNEVFKFIQYGGTWDSTTFGAINSLAGNTYSVNYASGDPFVELIVLSVPEPSTWALIFSGAAMLVGVQRFKRRS
jgi:autotransporter-associated beta strand protein